MFASSASRYAIRAYRPADRAAVRRICVACCWMGEHRPERIGDDWIWAEYWTRYFTDREPQHTWVVERSGDAEVVGYLTGTADAARVERFGPFLLPGIVWRVVRGRLLRKTASRRALRGMLRSFLLGELSLPPGAAERFGATFHFNLLGEARGQGVAARLLDTFIERMRSLPVRGVHVQPLHANAAVASLLARRGFRLIASRCLHAWSHLDGRPMELQTWVLPLGRATSS